MADALVAEGVRRSYGDTTALSGVSLSVGSGEVFALIGPNGAGKTTLVRALTGTTTPDDGRVSVFGDAPAAVERSRVGLLPQSFDPPARLTARELVDYYAGLYDGSRDSETVLAEVGLADAADTWYENLSGGQQRRVCVGVTLVNDPDVLFLDEPTTGIDPAGRRALWKLIEDLADGGTTVFLTTHYMAEAERLADRVGLLADGELVAVGAPEALVADHGGESRLVVATDAASEATAEGATTGGGATTDADVEALGDRFAVERTDVGFVFGGVGPAEIGDVVAALEARGVEYETLTWTEPDLEDVYLRLTGNSLGPAATAEAGRLAVAEVSGDGGRGAESAPGTRTEAGTGGKR